MNIFTGVPIVFIVSAQYVSRGRVGGDSPLTVETAGIAHCPQEFAVIETAYPVAGHGRVLACSLSQQLAQRVKSLFGDGGLPSALTAPFPELIENAPCLRQRCYVPI